VCCQLHVWPGRVHDVYTPRECGLHPRTATYCEDGCSNDHGRAGCCSHPNPDTDTDTNAHTPAGYPKVVCRRSISPFDVTAVLLGVVRHAPPLTVLPRTRRPTSLAPTRIPTTRFPTGTRIRQTQTQTESSSPFDDTATVVVVAICAGSIVLLAAFAACYIGRDYCRQHKRYRPGDPSGRVEVNEVTNATFFLDSGGGPPRGPDDGYLETTDTVEDGLESEAGVAMVAMPLASGSSDDTRLSGPEATEFFEWLTTLKKDRRVFAMLHREMRATQQSHTTAGERLRFSKPLSNFNRLADLFTHKKGQGVAPIDGMALLDWAQKTIDEFNAGG
jgi:hypothetical protein